MQQQLTRQKTLPRATEQFNFEKESKNRLKKQLDFIYKFLTKKDNIYTFDTIVDKIDDIYLEVKGIQKQ